MVKFTAICGAFGLVYYDPFCVWKTGSTPLRVLPQTFLFSLYASDWLALLDLQARNTGCCLFNFQSYFAF